ncbi:P-loop containing nucleoside triphosphate hydrolase protein [Rickenella mellea]|uniref:P-loop containing nucleoside triphosphate hydrolase protein n=1 Tax=Rickenella mellea TaxID=50990 RepID=A0A4Y7QMI7_9AGAM|nr:P-loop containing nucleoside triphosphate hydrolase protein [Rickenella mellea]
MKPSKTSIFLDTLLIPAYVAALSAIFLTLHLVFTSGPVKKIIARIFPRSNAVDPEDNSSLPNATPPPLHAGVVYEVKERIKLMGGSTIFLYKILRLLGCLALVGLTIATLVVDEGKPENKTSFMVQMKKHWGKKKKRRSTDEGFSHHEWLQISVLLTYLYTTLLALVAVAGPRRWSKVANRHLVTVLLIVFTVFAYRDVWPLCTITERPKDGAEGYLLWSKIAVLSLTALAVPLLIPRPYVPVDPKNPMAEPNPEQVTPLLSLTMFSFLDPLIFKAYGMPHLSHDELPPLCDYDYTSNLVKRSFKNLDTFSGAKRQHLFFGLMRIFRREYTVLAIMVILRVSSSFASPIGINQLLKYIEKNGEGAYVRPWVWISWLFLGPFVGSVVFQWYIFLATGTLVRVEGIITQLVFEHALRIRMKAATSDKKGEADSTAATTPDTASVADSEEHGDSGDADDSPVGSSADDTLRASTSSVKSDSSKAKGKDPSASVSGKSSTSAKVDSEKSGSDDNLVGKLNNMVTTDLNNITEGRDFLLLVLFSPFMICLAVWFLYSILGWSALVGMVVMFLGFPLPGYIAKVIQTVQVERMKRTDARVQVVTETMSVLRMVKLFGWEPKMNAQLAEKREDELKYILKRQILDLVNGNINYLIPVLTMIATYSTYTIIMKKQLNASTVFSSMAVFDILRDQLHMVFYMIPACIQAKVSLDRVTEFLQETELLDEYTTNPNEESVGAIIGHLNQGDAIGFRDATFAWSADLQGSFTPSRRNFRLRIEDELFFKRGCFNLIIGPTGSGKTSLLMALLGEMHFIPSGPASSFSLPRSGGVAYAAQEAWVQNETIKDNIIFGSAFDEERYKKVIYQCGLERDLSLFEAGDNTEVGEKGLTLSGGQKARITLARAVYSKAEIVLLDDVLAALDVHTSRWIVDKCFQGDLIRGRTVLLVTHNVAMASPIADFVVSMGRDGRVASRGTVEDALAKSKRLVKETAQENEAIEKAEEDIDPKEPDAKAKKSDGKLTVAEEIAEGHVSWNALKLYLFNLGGPLFWLMFLGGMALCDFSNTIQTWWLGYWASQYDEKFASEVRVSYYLTVYTLLLLLSVILYCFAYTLYMFGSIRASRTIHRKLIEAVTGTTLRWLDTTPTARVIARCTQDIRAVDGPVSQTLSWLCEMTLTMIIKFGAVVSFTPIFVFPGIAVGALGSWCGQIYIKAQLAVKREMSNARSPVLSHFGAAVAGLVSIRAYGSQTSFRTESMTRIDRYTRAARTFYNLNRWVCIRIDALGGLFAAALAAWLIYRQDLSKASNIGFSLNMAVGFSSMILWWVRVLNEFEVSGNSLERIQDYVSIEQEPKPTEDGVPPAYWPASGEIKVENLSARYSPDGPKVLENVSFHIKAGERVGVVGRTGSGKSSLTLSLLRCIYTDGTVYYDSIPTSSVNLDILRRNITIIPQIPELLSGTLRHNLDPFDEHDDATLNDALRSAGLFSLQQEDDEVKISLDSPISSGGANLSVGQRQILALARAIVRGSKLLILDEATSAIDYATDTIIQTSLRNELKGDVTLITVAHRLQTIMDADKIMVLDAGRITEFDSPKELLKKEGGMLKSLVDESGDKDNLYAMAEGRVQGSSTS